MNTIARFIVERSKVVLAVTGVITLLAIGMLFRVSFNADVSSFLLEGNEVGEEFAALQEKYEARDPINVVASLPDGESFTNPANLARLAQLRDLLSEVDGIDSVAAVVPETNPLTGQPIESAAIESLPDFAVSQLLEQSPVSDLLLSEDGRHTLVIVTPGEDATAAARAVTEVEFEGLELVFSGNPVIFSSVLDLLGWFILIIPPVVIALLVGTFYATIGDRKLSILAIVPAVLGSIWTFGLIFGLGKVRFVQDDHRSQAVTEDNPVLVLPFAQSQVVRAFMEGIDPELEHYLTFRDELFAGVPEAIAKSLSFKGETTRAKITSELTSAISSVLKNLEGFLEHMRFAHYAQPVVETITHMPRDELARVDETLVSLTSFRQRVTMSDETVGGPIDVAVISKGDGFIWIKRKHYFEAELNQRYIAHLYERDMTNGQSQVQDGQGAKV